MTDGGLREIFAGRRGRLLAALLTAELGAAVTGIAYSTVLPVASDELHGAALYGATVVAANFASVVVLATGLGSLARLTSHQTLLLATVLFLAGVGLSAGAWSMWLVLAGMVVRGLAGGLLAGFGLTAVGALYDDRLRPRVVGLFAVVWLVPSLVGPLVNSVVTLAASWRLAMAWPAALVVVARLLVSRDADLVPWTRDHTRRLDVGPALALLGGLVAAACAPAARGSVGVVLLVGGVAVAAAASAAVVHRQVRDPARVRVMAVFALLCLTFFGGHQLASLAAVEGLGRGVVTAALTVGGAQVAWSLTGLRRGGRRTPLGDAPVVGLALVAGGLVTLGVTMLAHPVGAAALLVGGWTVGGTGMGLAYRQLFSDALAGLAAAEVAPVAVTLELAELAATTIGSLGVGGWYSLGHVDGATAQVSLGGAYLLLGAAAAGAALVARVTSVRARPAPDARLAPWSER